MSETVLLTGASSGIGAAAAQRLAARGFRVFGTSRRERPPEPDENGVEWLALDVGDEASVQGAVSDLLNRAGRLDAVVCNAGFGIFGSVEEVPISEAMRQLDTNYFGVLRTLRATLPHLRGQRRGRVVLVGSLAGRAPIPFQSHYSASKAAIESLALSLRNELHDTGVKVSLIEPGDINTEFNDAMDWGKPADSVYGEKIIECERVIRESLPKAPGPEVVVEAIERALTAPRPRVRYAVGADSRLVPIGKRLLPDWLNLKLIRQHFGI